ncbi:hypothetical protein ACRAWD_22750 [Caulobacter segnis]
MTQQLAATGQSATVTTAATDAGGAPSVLVSLAGVASTATGGDAATAPAAARRRR